MVEGKACIRFPFHKNEANPPMNSLATEIYETVMNNVDDLYDGEDRALAAPLLYLVMAVLRNHVFVISQDCPEERTFLNRLERCFTKDHVVWAFVQKEKEEEPE